MKKFTIIIDNELSELYEEIANICNKSTEEILQDTLYKVIDIITRDVVKHSKVH